MEQVEKEEVEQEKHRGRTRQEPKKGGKGEKNIGGVEEEKEQQ